MRYIQRMINNNILNGVVNFIFFILTKSKDPLVSYEYVYTGIYCPGWWTIILVGQEEKKSPLFF